ncbi:MAG: thioredoxin family protein [Candidatus Omnitrophica bacterium]|nr:thioredoxin family protein [Candidatus Omnitrophota bacterium]
MELSPLALFGILLSGLALNLTPCVYPMLSVTVALFGKDGNRSFGAAFRKALLYVSGIILMYSTLGVVAALTGGFFGAILQNSPVLLIIAFLMFLLALSMFGLYEIQVPSEFLNWAGGKRSASSVGIFISGLLVGVFAAPCVGPPIVALLALVGQSSNPFSGFLVFFVLALGLSLPYFILGTFSGLLSKLPKSGEWLVWVKKVFGVVLLGLSLFYLSLSLYSDFLPLVVPTALAVGGVYLGFFDRNGDQVKAFKHFKRFAGTAAVLGALFLLFAKPTEGVVWETYTPEKLALAAQAKKPVVIDFFADWCLPCHELERYTYSNSEVIDALTPFARLKVDATNPNTPESLEPVNRFDVVGVPTVLFLDPNGKEIAGTRITGYVPPAEFLEIVDTVHDAAE